MRRLLAAMLAALALASAAQAAPPAPAGRFDYYVLALSWSPTYCASAGAARRDPLQCGVRRGFIVHGLWPQYERGWPSHCAAPFPASVPNDVQRRQFDLTPSARLVVHEWQTHGMCTGLDAETYFATARRLRAKVTIPAAYAAPAKAFTSTPAALRAALVKANPGLRPQGLALKCEKGRFAEALICFSKAGAFRACGADVKDRCLPGAMSVPASAGRGSR